MNNEFSTGTPVINNSRVNEPVMNGTTMNESVMNGLSVNVPVTNTSGAVIQNGISQSKRMGQRLRKMLDDFRYFGIGCLIYGIFFTICLYKGFHGITLPVLSLVTIGFLLGGFKRLDIKTGKNAWFYLAAWFILSVGNCLTGSLILIIFNTCGMFLLLLSFLLTHFCDTERWSFGKFCGEMFILPFAAIAYIGYPFRSAGKFFKKNESEKSGITKYIWLGVFISIPLLLVIVGLLVSADAVFRDLFIRLFFGIRLPEKPVWLFVLLAAGILGSYGIIAYLADGTMNSVVSEKSRWEPVVGITFLSIITVVYLVFSIIQISYLFLGSFDLPEGYTYAAYAREGFFQLLFVCMINLIIILICISRFRENKILKGILTLFSSCTFIMIASSAMRMILYIENYQLTFLRILVLWALAVITVLLAGCIVTIYKNNFPLLQFVTVTVTIFYIIFSLAKPDYFIARYNLTYNREDVDLGYLALLSTDAIPAMEEAGIIKEILDEDERIKEDLFKGESHPGSYSLYGRNLAYKADLSNEMGILDFNFSYYRAGNILNQYKALSEE